MRLISPLRDFLETETAGGVVLVAATAAALIWANSPWQDSYQDLWSSVFTIGFPEHNISLSLRGWVNDGLMAVFFFVVGLEIKRELVEGELRDRRKAALPAIAALGGMIVPAALFLAFTAGRRRARAVGASRWPPTSRWRSAFSACSAHGSPPSLKLFLLALAIVDDIGAIVVIAIFYSHGFDWEAAVAAVAVLAGMLLLRHFDVRSMLPFTVLAAVLVAGRSTSRACTRPSPGWYSGCSRRPARSVART